MQDEVTLDETTELSELEDDEFLNTEITEPKSPSRSDSISTELTLSRLLIGTVGGILALGITGALPIVSAIPLINFVVLAALMSGFGGLTNMSYIEAAASGGLTVLLLSGFALLTINPLALFGLPAVLFTVAGGMLMSALGLYAGRDARKGYEKAS